MNPILEAALVAACATASAFIFCAMLGLAWHVIQPNHEADLPCHPLERDREFTDLDLPRPTAEGRGEGPASSSFRPIDCDGSIEIICANCKTRSERLHALPNGDVVCPACHEKLLLDAVFAPLE